MKKNTMMRLASALLVLVMLTTCAISGTFAKYVYTTNGADEARVAKWGVQGTVKGGAFATEYDAHDDKTAFDVTVVTDPNGDGKQLVAPGTDGVFAGVALTGKPEVAVKITNTATLELDGWEVDGEFYCPIVFTVNGTAIKQDATNDTADKLEAAVKAAIEAANGEYEANTDLSTIEDLNGNYTWAWAFGDPDNNAKDTALGNAAAGLEGGTAATIKLTVVTLVEQID